MTWVSNSTDSGVTPSWACQVPIQAPSASILDSLRFSMLMWCQDDFSNLPALRFEVKSLLNYAPMDLLEEDPIEAYTYLDIIENHLANHLLDVEEYELLHQLQDWLKTFHAIQICD